MGAVDQANAGRVDPQTYYRTLGSITDRGSVSSLYCPGCKGHKTFKVFYATKQQGKDEGGIQCVDCRMTWSINEAMGHKLGLFPDDDMSQVDRTALKDY
jgi:hypothetical protein